MTIATQAVKRPNIALAEDDHEQIVIRQDAETGLRLIVAVHSTVLGPSLGGMRLKSYAGGLQGGARRRHGPVAHDDAEGVRGGPRPGRRQGGHDRRRRTTELREARLEGAAHVIDGLKGAYVTAEDIGTTCADMDFMSRFTRFAVGRSVENGGGGDPSPVTAETVFQALLRGLTSATGSAELDGRRIGVIGLGKVGSVLAAQAERGRRADPRLRPRSAALRALSRRARR